MPKPNTLLKRTTNALLDRIAATESGALPTDSALAREFDVSRTTMRAAIDRLVANGLLARAARGIDIRRPPARADYFAEAETDGPQELIERTFMQRVLLGDWLPGHVFSEAELARESRASTVSVREFLIGFSRFGLIEKQPRGGWRLLDFREEFATEVADMREWIELAAIERMPRSPDAAFRAQVEDFAARHADLLADFPARCTELPALDRDFHLFLIDRLGNRFARDFLDIVSFLFHYHYKWDKAGENERNRIALTEHQQILAALAQGRVSQARTALENHLRTSRRSLLAALRHEAPPLTRELADAP